MALKRAAPKSHKVKLKPANPFDLIRLLARSQNDPRKAVCELVQNSLDAQARRIEITWLNEHQVRSLRIFDDGQGVFPEMERRDALQRIAQTIGHSHKRSLTPSERQELLALGKYGIGLLGFWSVGRWMDIRSRVGGGDILVLRLERDREEASIESSRARRLDESATFTEVVIRGVEEGAARQIRPGRLQAYLASELRGQLLQRDVEVHIHDRIARGLAHKHFVVKPQRFVGLLLPQFTSLVVPGHEEARVELYLVGADAERKGRVQLACGGTTVLDDLALADGDEGPRAPWNSGRLEGVIDFPEFDVAPGTRRGIQQDANALAFLDALRVLELQLTALLHEDEAQRAQEHEETFARKIRHAFRRVAAALPEYDLPGVRARGAAASGGARSENSPGTSTRGDGPSDSLGLSEGAALAPVETVAERPPIEREPVREDAGAPMLFPPGPLARVRVDPSRLRVAPGATRGLRARAVDADGRRVLGAVSWHWSLEGAGTLLFEGEAARYSAPEEPVQSTIVVRAEHGSNSAQLRVPIEVLTELAGQERASGIPEPVAVEARGERWRSRFRDGRWEFNAAHKDYESVAGVASKRLKYLVHLFAKETVLRNFAGADDSELLERMVEVLTHLEA
ncbi:MAG TPA: ATP-binding protein [Planctomycetota bacterium]|nr:ATP-binding protein [Planctomycetota bacterium]